MGTQDTEAARRALYGRGATADDVAAYQARVERDRADEDKASDVPFENTAERRRARQVRYAAAGGCALLVAVVLAAWIASVGTGRSPGPQAAAATPDPVLWSSQNRERTRAALETIFRDPQVRTDPGTGLRLLTARRPNAGANTTDSFGYGTGTTDPGQSGQFGPGTATVIVSFDKPCAFSWTAHVTMAAARTTTGGWETRLASSDAMVAGATAALIPVESTFRVAASTTDIHVRIHAPRGVRYIWFLEINKN